MRRQHASAFIWGISMYCPNCEFEIRQEVTECPICGGALVQHPEETDEDTGDAAATENEAPPDLNISSLLQDAKHEFDSLEELPESPPQKTAAETEPDSFDFASLLNGDSGQETGLPDTESLKPGSGLFSEPPQEKSPMPGDTDTPAGSDDIFAQEAPAKDHDPFADPIKGLEDFMMDEKPVADESAPPARGPAPEDSTPFIDELSGKKLTHALNTMPVPPPKTGLQSPDPGESGNGITDSVGGIPGPVRANNGDNILKLSDDAEPSFSLEQFEDQPESEQKRSSLRFVVPIVLIAALAAAGAYFLTPYVLEKSIPDSAREAAVHKKPAPARSAPAEAPQPAPAPESAASDLPASQEQLPMQTPPPDASQHDAQPPAAHKTSEETTDAAAGRSRPEQTAVLGKKPARSQEPAPAAASTPLAESKSPEATAPYSVHVFSFKTRQAARAEVGRLKGLGFDAYLETVDLEAKGIWHRVKVGHFPSRTEAEQARISIKGQYPDIEPIIYRNR